MPKPQTQNTCLADAEYVESIQEMKNTWNSRKTAVLGELLCKGHLLGDALEMVDFLSKDIELASEFEFYRTNQEFAPEELAVKRYDYTAEQLVKTTLMSVDAAYMTLSHLKQHPERVTVILQAIEHLKNLNAHGVIYNKVLKKYTGCRLSMFEGNAVGYRPTGDGKWCVLITGPVRRTIDEQFFFSSEQEAIECILKKISPVVDSILFRWSPVNIIFTEDEPHPLHVRVFNNTNSLNKFLDLERTENIYLLSLLHSDNRINREPECKGGRIVPHGQMLSELSIKSTWTTVGIGEWKNDFSHITADKIMICLINAYFHSTDYFVIYRAADDMISNAIAKAICDFICEENDIEPDKYDPLVYECMSKRLHSVRLMLTVFFMRHSSMPPISYRTIARELELSYNRVLRIGKRCEELYLLPYRDGLLFTSNADQLLAKKLERTPLVCPSLALPG